MNMKKWESNIKIFFINKKAKMKKKMVGLSAKNIKYKIPEIYIFYKTLVISIICSKCGSKHKRIFKEEESL